MNIICGWFEAEYGVNIFDYEDITNAHELAEALINDYGSEWVGVYMEIDGDYTDGNPVDTIAVIDLLETM